MKPQKSTKANKFNLTVIFLLIFSVGLACSFNSGVSDSTREDSDSKATIKKKKVKVAKKNTKIKKTRESSGESENEDEGDFIAEYSDIENEAYVQFDGGMREQNVLEEIAEELNNTLAMPEDVIITFDDCGEVNAFYSPGKKSITVCYELMEDTLRNFVNMGMTEDEAMETMIGATIFIFFHELGHCLIDVYDLPATGREEDSVDQLSTYVLMDEMSEEGTQMAISGVMLFRSWAENQQLSEGSFADEHSLSSQRYYNIACWMYGRDREAFSHFVENEILPESRAVRCEDEYSDMSRAWERLLKPWMKT